MAKCQVIIFKAYFLHYDFRFNTMLHGALQLQWLEENTKITFLTASVYIERYGNSSRKERDKFPTLQASIKYRFRT